MSYNISKCDWFKHLHVQVALWEETSVHTDASSLHCCTCKKKIICDIKHCLTKRLSVCKDEGLVPNVYLTEVDAFFEFLKHPKYNSKRITKLVQERDCTISLLECLDMFYNLAELEKNQTILKFDSESIPNLFNCVQSLTHLLQCSHNIQSQVPSERIRRQQSAFNDTTWLRHMYRMLLSVVNNIHGRVRWQNVHNGFDPNNSHINPTTGLKEHFTTRADLISELKSLVPICLSNFSIPRSYREEIHLLQVFLEGGVLDKTKVQKELMLRRTAVGLQEVLLTLQNRRNMRHEIIQNTEPSRICQLLGGLLDLEKRLKVFASVREEHVLVSVNKQRRVTSSDQRHDESVESSPDVLQDLDNQFENTPVDAVIEKTTSNETSEQEMDITVDVGEMVEADRIEDPQWTGEQRISADNVSMFPVHDDDSDYLSLSDSMIMQYWPGDSLEREIMLPTLINDNTSDILDQTFHQLLEDAEKMVNMPLPLSDINSRENNNSLENRVSPKVTSAQTEYNRAFAITNGHTNSEDLGASTNTCTPKAYTTSGLTRCDGTVETATAISTRDRGELDRDNILEVWSGLGYDFIKTADPTGLLKMEEIAADICKQTRLAKSQLHKGIPNTSSSSPVNTVADDASILEGTENTTVQLNQLETVQSAN